MFISREGKSHTIFFFQGTKLKVELHRSLTVNFARVLILFKNKYALFYQNKCDVPDQDL